MNNTDYNLQKDSSKLFSVVELSNYEIAASNNNYKAEYV